MREKFASRLGFIFLSAGSAIGLGNVWRFPFVAGQNGGGWFVAIYLVCLLLIGLPVLVMEFAVGRASQRSIRARIRSLRRSGSPPKKTMPGLLPVARRSIAASAVSRGMSAAPCRW